MFWLQNMYDEITNIYIYICITNPIDSRDVYKHNIVSSI